MVLGITAALLTVARNLRESSAIASESDGVQDSYYEPFYGTVMNEADAHEAWMNEMMYHPSYSNLGFNIYHHPDSD